MQKIHNIKINFYLQIQKKFCPVRIARGIIIIYTEKDLFSFEIKDFLLCFRHGSCPVFEFLKKSSKKLAGHEREEYGNYLF